MANLPDYLSPGWIDPLDVLAVETELEDQIDRLGLLNLVRQILRWSNRRRHRRRRHLPGLRRSCAVEPKLDGRKRLGDNGRSTRKTQVRERGLRRRANKDGRTVCAGLGFRSEDKRKRLNVLLLIGKVPEALLRLPPFDDAAQSGNGQ